MTARARRFVVSCVAALCGVAVLAAQNVARLDVLSVAGHKVDAQRGAVIESMPEGEALDVELACYGVPADHDVYLLVRSRDGRSYEWIGPAKKQRRETGDICLVPDARFGNATGQRRTFVLRVVALQRGQAMPSQIRSLDRFPLLSPAPVEIAVLRMAPEFGDLRLTTVGGLTAEPDRVLSSRPNASVGGTSMEGKAIDVVIHYVGTSTTRIVGPADRHASNWELHDASLSAPGFPHWREVELFAITSHDGKSLRGRQYETVHDLIAERSQVVRVRLEDEAAPPPMARPSVAITGFASPGGSWQHVTTATTLLRIASAELRLCGTVKELPQDARVAVIVGATDSNQWSVLAGGPVMNGEEWCVPRVPLPAGNGKRRIVWVYAVAAEDALPAGQVDYEAWQRHTKAISSPLSLESRGTNQVTAPDIDVAIRDVQTNRVVVSVGELPPDCDVYVGQLSNGTATWTFVKATKTAHTDYTAVGIPLLRPPLQKTQSELVAIVTSAPLPSPELTTAEWERLAIANSDFVSPSHDGLSGDTSTAVSPVRLATVTVLAAVLLSLLVFLFVMEQRFGVVVPFLRALATICRGAWMYTLRSLERVSEFQPEQAVKAGVLLVVGVFLAWGYLPLYQNVLREAFELSRPASQSMALLLVLSLVMIGLVLHVTATHSSRRGHTDDTKSDALRTFMLVLLMLLAGSFLCFQFLVFETFHASRAPEGSVMPVAWGAMAVFVSMLEMMNGYWVMHFGVGAVAGAVCCVVAAPFWILEQACTLLIALFTSTKQARTLPL